MAYIASTGDGARLPVINRRVSPQDTGMYTIRGDIIRAVQCPADARVAYVRLYERPLTDYAGTGVQVKDNGTGASLTATVTFPPAPGTFYTNPYLACVYFNISAVGMAANISYTGMGSLVVAEDMNWVYNNAKSGAKPFESAEITVGAGQVANIQKLFVTTLWEVEADGALIMAPSNVEVRSRDITDPNAYYSTIKNTGAASRKFRYRGLPMQTPEA